MILGPFASGGLVLAGSFALFLAAAKAHGRQLRLERERAGYWEAAFGGKNPEWVEALWRRERILFWSAAAAASLAGLAYAWAAVRFSWPMPLRDAQGRSPPWVLILLGALWPLIAAFILTGIASIARFAAALHPSASPSTDLSSGAAPSRAWRRKAWTGTAGWWALTLGLTLWIAVLSWGSRA